MDFASCAPDVIYRAMGIPEQRPEFFAYPLPNNGTPAVELFAPYNYKRQDTTRIYSKNERFKAQLVSLYKKLNLDYRFGPGSVLTDISNACTCRTVIYTRTPGGHRVVYETYRPNDRGFCLLVSERQIRDHLRPQMGQGRKFLYLASVGSANFGHWLVDDLPRLKAFFTIRENFPRHHIIVVLHSYGDKIDAVRMDSATAFIGDHENYSFLFIDQHHIVGFDSLFYCSPTSYHPTVKSPQALQEMALRLTRGTRRVGSPIYVDRREQRGRTPTNNAHIKAELERRGFLIVDTEAMPVMEQIRIFSEAPVVVGCMGAAMTTSVFCKSGTPVIYLAPEGWLEPFHWDLNSSGGQVYHACYGRTDGTNVSPNLRNYVIDCSILTKILDRLSRPAV